MITCLYIRTHVCTYYCILNVIVNSIFYFIQSLSGHTTPVEAVRFGGTDDSMVIAGSMSGALKIWDLEAAKSKDIFFCYRLKQLMCMAQL